MDRGAEQLERVQINAQDTSFFAELSFLYDVPIGLEAAAYEDELTRYSIDFQRGDTRGFTEPMRLTTLR